MRWDWVKRATEYDEYIIMNAFDEVEEKHVEIFKSCALIVHDLFEDILANVDEAETLKEKADLSKVLKLYYPVDLLNDVFKEKKNKQGEYKFLFLCEALHKNKPNPKEEDWDLYLNFMAI